MHWFKQVPLALEKFIPVIEDSNIKFTLLHTLLYIIHRYLKLPQFTLDLNVALRLLLLLFKKHYYEFVLYIVLLLLYLYFFRMLV